MKILAFDTATRSGSVAILDDSRIIVEMNSDTGKTHSESLLPAVDHVLHETGYVIDDIDGYALTIGPGSFTGLRIGLSTVKGLAWASGKPVMAVSTLEALAHNIPFTDKFICPVLDARKKEIYTAIFRWNGSDIERVSEDAVMPPAGLFDLIDGETIFLGPGLNIYGAYISERLGNGATFAPENLWSVRASNVGIIALEGFKRGEGRESSILLPRYIRPSEAELNWGKKRDQ